MQANLLLQRYLIFVSNCINDNVQDILMKRKIARECVGECCKFLKKILLNMFVDTDKRQDIKGKII